jgi:hypothetical protein
MPARQIHQIAVRAKGQGLVVVDDGPDEVVEQNAHSASLVVHRGCLFRRRQFYGAVEVGQGAVQVLGLLPRCRATDEDDHLAGNHFHSGVEIRQCPRHVADRLTQRRPVVQKRGGETARGELQPAVEVLAGSGEVAQLLAGPPPVVQGVGVTGVQSQGTVEVGDGTPKIAQALAHDATVVPRLRAVRVRSGGGGEVREGAVQVALAVAGDAATEEDLGIRGLGEIQKRAENQVADGGRGKHDCTGMKANTERQVRGAVRPAPRLRDQS